MTKTKLYLMTIGTILLISAAVLIANTFLFVSSAIEISGRVTRQYHEPGTAQRYVKVLYTIDNKSFNYNFPIGKNHSHRYPEGSYLSLLYAPENPEDVRLDSFWSLWGLNLILSGSGLLACIAAFVKKA